MHRLLLPVHFLNHKEFIKMFSNNNIIYMKIFIRLFSIVAFPLMVSCNQATETKTNNTSIISDTSAIAGGQENVKDDDSQKDVVKVAMSSKDHTTLVAALKQAGLVTSLSNAGPFTVFAPTNEAFNKLPAGTVDGLMKDDKKEDLPLL